MKFIDLNMEITSGGFKASMGINVLTEESSRKQDYFISPGNFTAGFRIRPSTGILHGYVHWREYVPL